MEREFPRSKSRLPSLLLALLGLGPELLFGQSRAPPRQLNAVLGGSVLLSPNPTVPRCPQMSPNVPKCPFGAISVSPELLFGQSRAPPRQLNAVLGGSVLLSPALAPNASVKEIEWSFSGGSGATIQVAEVAAGRWERPDPRDRFGRRLEMFNSSALRLRELQRGDSGVFAARIKLQPALVEDQAFNLTVYESVPSPRTRSQLLASTLEWCNLTLQCQGSGRGAVNVTWRRDSLAWGELGTGWHRLSPDGTTLRVALPPAATNVTYTCTVSNPADRKVARFELQELCQGGGGPSAFSTSGYVVLSLILVAVSLGGAFWCWRVNSAKAAAAAATPTAPPEESPGEPQFSDIVCRSPPEGNDQGPSPPEAPQEPQKSESSPPKTPKTSPGGEEQGQRAPEDTAEEVT
ncbi:SLAM family member 5 isoform X2 [Oenanthe melanoleuca]|uniref:SLAM family member 5 isoform X2 n=1 Tax=Oenanthe melanoleuca TaxID=2939378 RepID=UPI0024C1AC17|nr:SLAM family member 5 isoform X2 [Oenanthe melanoleuca]